MFIATTAAISVASAAARAGIVGDGVASTVTTGALIYVPLLWLLYRRMDLADYGVRFTGIGKDLVVFAVFTVVTLVPFYVGNHIFETQFLGRQLSVAMPVAFGGRIVAEVLAVALPEEFFYRGYLQRRLEESTGTPWRVLGVQVGWGTLAASLLFVLAHTLVAPAWWHVGILVPAVTFAWLRNKTGSILAPTLYHAVCNLTMAVAQTSYGSS
jgi:membrane protease YdiL (CAAX protease family)